MSQKKVDQYKKEKANRQKIMKRERLMTRLGVAATVLVLVVLVGWFGLAVYNNSKAVSEANKASVTTELDTTDIDTYINDIATAEAGQ